MDGTIDRGLRESIRRQKESVDLAPIYRSIYRYLELAWIEAPTGTATNETYRKHFRSRYVDDISVAKRDDELRRQHRPMYVSQKYRKQVNCEMYTPDLIVSDFCFSSVSRISQYLCTLVICRLKATTNARQFGAVVFRKKNNVVRLLQRES